MKVVDAYISPSVQIAGMVMVSILFLAVLTMAVLLCLKACCNCRQRRRWINPVSLRPRVAGDAEAADPATAASDSQRLQIFVISPV